MGVRQLWRYLFSGQETLTFAAEPYRPVNALVEGLFPGYPVDISKDVAMGVPAFKRGRDMICAIGTLPLETVRRDNTVVDNPFLRQIDPNVPNVVTLTQTVEDLLCYGVAWWRITQFGYNGFPLYARRYDPLKVSIVPPAGFQPSMLPSGISPLGVVWMDGVPVDKTSVIRFDSPNAPVLGTAGRRVLARAIAIEDAAEMYADNPRPMDYFTPADPNAEPLDDDEVSDVLSTWQRARKTRSTAYLGGTMTYNPVDVLSPADLQLIDIQRKASLDIANLMGVDAEDIGVSTTSRTYQNAVDRRKDRVNDTLAAYMLAVTDRLSMGDVTVNGQRVRFNLNDYLKADPKTRAEVQQIYKDMGVTDAAEIREDEGRPPRAIKEPAVSAPASVAAPARKEVTA